MAELRISVSRTLDTGIPQQATDSVSGASRAAFSRVSLSGLCISRLVPLAGGKLQGEIPDTEKDGSITVSVSEEGEDGLLLEVEGGETYHFIPAVMDENDITLRLNTEGLGQVAYAGEGEELQFDDEYPAQSAYWNLLAPETVTIGAKADEGWKFVKWTRDGEDFTTEAQFTVEVAEAVEYVAVFEPAS